MWFPVGFTGGFRYAADKPDGAPRKLLDTTKLTRLGWRPRIPLKQGLQNTYAWFVENKAVSV